MVRAIPIGWPGLIGNCRSIFLGYSHWSLTSRPGWTPPLCEPTPRPSPSLRHYP